MVDEQQIDRTLPPEELRVFSIPDQRLTGRLTQFSKQWVLAGSGLSIGEFRIL